MDSLGSGPVFWDTRRKGQHADGIPVNHFSLARRSGNLMMEIDSEICELPGSDDKTVTSTPLTEDQAESALRRSVGVSLRISAEPLNAPSEGMQTEWWQPGQ